MPRRTKQASTLDDLHDIFMHVSAWWALPVALLAFLVIQIAVATLAANPLLKGLAPLGLLFSVAVPCLVLFIGFVAAVDKRRRRDTYNKQTSIESVRQLSWSDFELLIGEAYRRQGYRVSEAGGGGPDGGVDLILKNEEGVTVVQCKHWKTYKVGVSFIRELYGVMTAERASVAIFVTSGEYTQEAKAFARGKPLQLISGTELFLLIGSLREQQAVHPMPAVVNTISSPTCPTCQNVMVLRTAKTGKNVGAQFWGCPSFPKCRGTRQV